MKAMNSLVFVCAVLLVMAAVAHAVPTPLIQLGFASDDLTNTGSLASDGWMTDGSTPVYIPGVAADLGNDMSARAMDNTLTNPSSYIGLMVGNNTAGTPGDVANALNGAQSLTICGWFYAPTTYPGLGANANAWYRRENSNPWVYNIRSYTELYSRPRTYINGTTITHPPYQFWNYDDEWFFAAITYDAGAGTLTQYRASTGMTSVIPVAYALSVGPLNASDYGIMFGERAWFAYMDNLRVYASKTDASGALSDADLTGIFSADKLEEVPEPATILVLALGAGCLLRRRRA